MQWIPSLSLRLMTPRDNAPTLAQCLRRPHKLHGFFARLSAASAYRIVDIQDTQDQLQSGVLLF